MLFQVTAKTTFWFQENTCLPKIMRTAHQSSMQPKEDTWRYWTFHAIGDYIKQMFQVVEFLIVTKADPNVKVEDMI